MLLLQFILSITTREAKGTMTAARQIRCEFGEVGFNGSTPGCLKRPMAEMIAVIWSSCEKSAYIERLSGNVVGDESRVLLVCVWSCTGVSVKRASSSLTQPTP